MGKHGGNGKGNGKGNKHKGLGQLLDPSQVQSGKTLLKLAKAMTRLQTRPQVKAYARLANELRGQQVADTTGTARLGRLLGRNVAGAYRGFDRGANQQVQNAAALGQMGVNQQQQINNQSAAEMKSFQTGQLGGLQEAMSLRGAPGGGLAQQQLRDLVAGQQQRLAAESGANASFARAQGNAYTGLAQGIQQAGRIQGAAAQSDLARTIASQMADIRLKSGADIREALGKKADVKALKGSQLVATLGQLTKDERDYITAIAATKADIAHNKAMESIGLMNAQTSQGNLAERIHHDRATEHGGSGSGGSSGKHDHKANVKHAAAQARQYIGENGCPPGGYSTRNAAHLAGQISSSIPANIANHVARKILKRRCGGGSGGSGGDHSGGR